MAALRLYTLGSAWFSFDEKTRGSLEPGKLGDVVIIDGDPLTDSRALLHVTTTIKGGEGRNIAEDGGAYWGPVDNDSSRAKADGKVTAHERGHLTKMQNRASRDIYRQKHDAQTVKK